MIVSNYFQALELTYSFGKIFSVEISLSKLDSQLSIVLKKGNVA